MHHYFESITNKSGDVLVGYFARVINPATQNTVTLAADNNGTPIVTVSGVENMAKSDENGNLSFYVEPGTYNLEIYAPNATSFILRVQNVAMNSGQGPEGPEGPEGPQGEGLAEVMAATGASLVGFKGSAASAVPRSVLEKSRETVSVLDFGATVNNGSTNASPAIQAALDYLNTLNGGTLLFPAGTYLLSTPITLRDRVDMRGVGSHVGSIIRGASAINLFQSATCQHVTFEKLAFDGNGCTAIKQTDPAFSYFVHLAVRDCHFYGQLSECVYANLIFAEIYGSTFGVYGTVGAAHRHIVSAGNQASDPPSVSTTNVNLLEKCRFYYAKGTESVRFDSGGNLRIISCNFEQNRALPLRLSGMYAVTIEDNWFEFNYTTNYEIEINGSTIINDSSATRINGNHFVPAANIQRIVQVNTQNFDSSGWSFDGNVGYGNTPITNNAAKLRNIAAVAQLNDASGAALALIDGSALYERTGRTVTLQSAMTFPTTTSNSNAKIGGLPYASATVSGGKVIGFSADVATDGNAPTMTLFAPGTLTPLTNAALSGKSFYITIVYQVLA